MNNETNAERGISEALMGAQRKGQLMISVRPNECFPRGDIESLPKSYGG